MADEEDARNSLLDHFSSKSTNQTAILLGLAVAVFVVVQTSSAIPDKLWQYMFLVSVLGGTVYLITRAVDRLVFWGEMADAIVRVEMSSVEYTKECLQAGAPQSIKLIPTYLARLSVSACDYYTARMKKSSINSSFHKIRASKWYTIGYIVTLIALNIILVLLRHYSYF